jgi:hypothetical protein
VRRTPRPTGDRQTPETVAQPGAGTTNTASPVSGDHQAVSSRVSSQAHVELTKTIAETAAIPQWRAALAASFLLDEEGWRPPLPDADGPTVHIASEHVRIGERYVRQRCGWCGFLLSEADTDHEAAYLAAPGLLVEFDRGQMTLVPYVDGGPLPPGCCALPDDGEPVCICSVESTRCPDCRDEDQADEDEPVDPNDGYPVDLCRKHTGTCSNRCLLRAGHAGECDDDPPKPGPGCYPPADGWDGASVAADDGPDEAQETRAAADWPAEETDRG